MPRKYRTKSFTVYKSTGKTRQPVRRSAAQIMLNRSIARTRLMGAR